MLRSIGLLFLISAAMAAGCSQQQSPSSEKAPAANTAATAANHAAATPAGAEAKPERTPSTNLTAADIAKLKWLEGTWKGMDGDEPFFERYHFDGTTMIVEGFKDGSLKEVSDTTRFELKDGQFGHAGRAPLRRNRDHGHHGAVRSDRGQGQFFPVRTTV